MKTVEKNEDIVMVSILGFLSLFIFLSFWILILILFSHYFHQYFNVLFLSIFMLLSSTLMLITGKNPFRVIFQCERYVIDNNVSKMIFHILIHVIPTFFIILMYTKYYVQLKITHISTYFTILLLFIYAMLHNFQNIYTITFDEIILHFILSLGVYNLLLLIYK